MPQNEKGAKAERELLQILYNRGWAVVRSAGSGHNSLSPDIVAIKAGRVLAFECKAWDQNALSIGKDQFETILEWRRRSGQAIYVAWRINRFGWCILDPTLFRFTTKNYVLSKRDALNKGIALEDLAPEAPKAQEAPPEPENAPPVAKTP
jgi:Holliday junction resolvase